MSLSKKSEAIGIYRLVSVQESTYVALVTDIGLVSPSLFSLSDQELKVVLAERL